jgi:hypothetical protein
LRLRILDGPFTFHLAGRPRKPATSSGFEGLYNPARTKPGPIVEVACWAHCRRKFYDVWEATKSPVAKEALDQIAAVYAIEEKARFAPAAERVKHRRETAPLLDKFFDWGKATVGKLSGIAGCEFQAPQKGLKLINV